MGWEEANCRGLDPALFFADRGDVKEVRRAQAVCVGCVVRTECLDYANRNPTIPHRGERDTTELPGVWGGMTMKERRLHRRGRATA